MLIGLKKQAWCSAAWQHLFWTPASTRIELRGE
jgi:hypothetical protein